MNEILKMTVVTLALIGILFLVGLALSIGLEKIEKVHCESLKSQSIEFPRFFYLTQSEKDMCDFFKITIDAPVR